MANHNVSRILVDEGSSYNIIYKELFINLIFSRKDLALYESTNLQGFNGSTVRRCGYDLGGWGGV
jgi:hypothetical protein